ncbi:tandem-95 repeat protein, partial [Methylobacterium segetis]|uniref:tandem-95 repeat protein n=1 Tax=Methylobacterium segetis TaxID=2488750 RepID=UPI001A9D1A6A
TPANQMPASGTTGVVTINPSPTNQAAIIAKFADEVKTLTEVYKAKISAIGIGDSSLTYLDPIDNTGGAEKVTTPSALSASLLGSPVPSASIAAFTLSVNARVVPGITKANLVSTPLGLKIDANLAALKPYLGDSNTVVASVTFTDGTTLVTDLVVTGVLPHAFDPPGLGASPPSEILVEAGAETAGVPESVVRLVRAANAPAYDTAGWTQLTPATFAKAGTYGTTLLDTAANTLTYALDNARSATNALQAGAIVTEKVEIRLVGGLNKDIAFTITGSNDAPVAADAAASGDEDGVLAGQLSAIDPDTSVDDLIVALVGEATHGHVAIDARGHYTYTPDADFNGTDQFTYRVNDGSDAGNVATVTLTVRPVEDAPRVAGPLTLEADEGSAARLLDLLLNARDADGDALAITDLRYSVDGQPSAAPPAGLSLSGSTLAVDPSDPAFDALAEGATRTIVAAYDIVDGQGGSVRQTQTLVLHGVNDAPSASSAAAATEAGTPLSGSVSATDIDGDALTYAVRTAPVHGTLSLGADGRYTYAPDAGYAGSDGFTFTASDSRLAATGTIDLTVKPDAAAPVVTGTAGDDVLQGGAGDDRIDGRGGDDLLSGGAGADTFVFSPLAGHARIADFEIHRDVVEVSSNAFADEAAILAQATQVGADTVISLDATHSLTLQNVATASLTAADFHVV